MKDLLPGPFTLIFERSSHLNPDLNPSVKSVGIRIPDCTVCNKLVSQLGAPIALTSANISGKSSAVSIDVSSLLVPDFQPFAQVIFNDTTNNFSSGFNSLMFLKPMYPLPYRGKLWRVEILVDLANYIP